ncbi:ABC transporter permease [Aliirhizobium cellulosilyticum]|jgi:peptide/nickel transport system permease protein|uniref:Peptide/nickel transport system permease protein n=1 Tax=Aliirhizobium cellulosilyticum TaxID=393664 RepID=A0A7W6Y356_9HYPH|nr:ABC transporter permease [Rhizobium cellulosilyticum]MBB4350127.1 peptide/nickel transport system permease protein [Rhizobium cellulosilyticum]MBB4413306.1 peptide/nickel transport system permease protein [Rhizobium cellulosilyticum]MBB4447756.1 peptide/nickel transport system permease protein [Rhizobium cellulosilyticum]
MYAYILRRILATIPVMLIVAFIVFSLLYLTPGDPAAVIAGEHATAEDIARIRANLGLNDPFLLRFGTWIASIMQFDLGTSLLTNMPVSQMIGQRIEPTLSLMLPTLILAVCIAVPLGVIAAWRAGTKVDHFITVFAVLGFSVPVFVVGYALVWSFSLKLGWLPVQGYAPIGQGVSRWFQHLVLPCLTLSSAYIALITRITRTAVLEVLQQDYIRTAEAKGVGRRAILFVHALKNASVPIITVIGIGVALLIGGAVVTESVFAIPGLGRLTMESIMRRDYPVIQAIVLLFSISYVLVNLLIDIAYTFVDPRIRY